VAVGIVVLSPLFIVYSDTKPLTDTSAPWDTATHYSSGFPIPFMHRTSVGMRIDVDRSALVADLLLVSLAMFALSWVVGRVRRNRRSRPA